MSHSSISTDFMGLISRQITPDIVNNLASTLGEDRERTASALSTSVPSVLAAFGDVARSDTGAAHLEQAMGQTRSAAAKGGADAGAMPGARAARADGAAAAFMERELGSRSSSIADVVARTSGIKRDSAGKLLGGVATIAMAALSKGAGVMGFGALRRSLLDQRAGWVGRLPGPMASLFNGAPAARAERVAATAGEPRYVGPAIRELPAPRRRRWLLPLALIALAILAIPLFRGLRRPSAPVPEVPPVARTVPAVPPAAPAPPAETAEPPAATAEPPTATAEPEPPAAAVPEEEAAPGDELGGATRSSDTEALASFLASSEGTTPQRFILAPLTFRFGSDELTPDGKAVVDDLAGVLRMYPSASIRFEGHTDNVGSPESNLALSAARADAVKARLGASGVDEARLDTAGLGQDQPIASNDSEEGRAQNRRTEIVVTSK